MSFRKIFCPNCGQETQVNVDKPFNFCLHCGYKIILQAQQSENINDVSLKSENMQTNDILSKKLEEVAFYYQLSREKREYENLNAEPVYYLKAQDMLVDLSEEYPADYRIWWELSKPIDYGCLLSETDNCLQHSINEDYFGKALDCADLSRKRKLIEEHDAYIENKNSIREKVQAKRLDIEKKQQEEYLAIETVRRREEVEKQEIALVKNRELWDLLFKKNYTMINNSFFTFQIDNNQKIICIFKLVSNMMYLMGYRMDGNKGNTIYCDQTISIKFDNSGYGLKFDNTSIRVKGLQAEDDRLRVLFEGDVMKMNTIELLFDNDYVAGIMKRAKKPMISFTKIFI